MKREGRHMFNPLQAQQANDQKGGQRLDYSISISETIINFDTTIQF